MIYVCVYVYLAVKQKRLQHNDVWILLGVNRLMIELMRLIDVWIWLKQSFRYLHERFSQLQEEINLLKTNLVKYKVAACFFHFHCFSILLLQLYFKTCFTFHEISWKLSHKECGNENESLLLNNVFSDFRAPWSAGKTPNSAGNPTAVHWPGCSLLNKVRRKKNSHTSTRTMSQKAM